MLLCWVCWTSQGLGVPDPNKNCLSISLEVDLPVFDFLSPAWYLDLSPWSQPEAILTGTVRNYLWTVQITRMHRYHGSAIQSSLWFPLPFPQSAKHLCTDMILEWKPLIKCILHNVHNYFWLFIEIVLKLWHGLEMGNLHEVLFSICKQAIIRMFAYNNWQYCIK